MKALPKILFAVTAVGALSVAYPASVQAVPTTYQYTGNHFTNVSAPYTTSMFVSGMVTLVGPLAPNMPLTSVSPIAFSFSDGRQAFTNTTASFIVFQFATGPTGAITSWMVSVSFGNPVVGVIETFNSQTVVTDAGNAEDGTGKNFGNPGTWSPLSAVADTGSTLSLMTLTLMALGLTARRFKRAAA